MHEICSLDSEKFDYLFKVLSIFEKSESIIISNSNIKQQFNTAIVYCDMSEFIGKDINLHILNPKRYVKLLKAFSKKTKKISILEDVEKFIITNNEINIYCPKQIEKLGLLNSNMGLLNAKALGDGIKLDKDVRKTIKQLSSDNDFLDILVHRNQMKAVSIPETAIYKFDNYINEDIDETNCDFRLRVYTVLEIDGDSYDISLGVNDDTYWVRSIVDVGFTKITIDENAIRRDDLDNMLI